MTAYHEPGCSLGDPQCAGCRRNARRRVATGRSYRVRVGPPEVDCRFCHGPMQAKRVGVHYCSSICKTRAKFARLWAAGSRRRFPHFNTGQRLKIAERDGWRCGLCGAVIDQALRYPHPGSLSIDHIDPDGEHVPENWQASHLVCNVQAGDKRAAA